MVTGHRDVFSVCFEKIGRSLLACCTIYLYASLSTLFSSPSSPNMVSLYLFHANVQIKTWARPHEHVRIPHVCGDSRCFMAVFWLSAGNVGNSLDHESIEFLLPKPSWRPVIQMLGIVSYNMFGTCTNLNSHDISNICTLVSGCFKHLIIFIWIITTVFINTCFSFCSE